MAVEVKFYSAEDLWELSQLPEYADKLLELSDGELIEMTPAGGPQGVFAGELYLALGAFIKQHRLGYTTIAEGTYILYKNPSGRDTVRVPDIGFIRAELLPDGIIDGYIPHPPDLAVEVVSPTDRADDIEDKIKDYLKYGTQMVWTLYPKTKTARVDTPASSYRLSIDDVLDGGDVVPGFSIKLAEIFAATKPINKPAP